MAEINNPGEPIPGFRPIPDVHDAYSRATPEERKNFYRQALSEIESVKAPETKANNESSWLSKYFSGGQV